MQPRPLLLERFHFSAISHSLEVTKEILPIFPYFRFVVKLRTRMRPAKKIKILISRTDKTHERHTTSEQKNVHILSYAISFLARLT